MRKNEKKYEQVENPEQIADTLGISAVMVQDMKGKRINGYTFDINVCSFIFSIGFVPVPSFGHANQKAQAMTSFEGDTGPYLQYAHARLKSIWRKSTLSEAELSALETADLFLLTEPHAIELVRTLAQWPDVVLDAVKKLEPATILTYLFKMTHALSSSYDQLNVIGSEAELQKARLALYESARVVLYNGMRLLGLSPVDRM